MPEGEKYLTKIEKLEELREIYEKEEKFLFFSVGEEKWVVNTTLAAPRFFRDRFAKALGKPELGNWKEMHQNKELMQEGAENIEKFINKLQNKAKR